MGCAVSWIAIKSDNSNQIREMLEVTEAGEASDRHRDPLSMADLGNGWMLLYLNSLNSDIVADSSLARLSKIGQLIVCKIEEHIMYSSCSMWMRSERLWRIAHDSQEGMYHLEQEGSLPEVFKSIKKEKFKAQHSEGGSSASVDLVFEIPLELAADMCGFQHNLTYPFKNKHAYIPLMPQLKTGQPNDNADRPWWKVW